MNRPHESALFLVYELGRGKTLRDRLQEGPSLSLVPAVRLSARTQARSELTRLAAELAGSLQRDLGLGGPELRGHGPSGEAPSA